MSEIVIRNAIASDAEEIARIHVESWQYAYRGLMPDDLLDELSIPTRTETWQKRLGDTHKDFSMLVAEKENNIVGWCTFGKSRDDDAAPDTGEIYGIYWDPKNVRNGIGTQLIEQAVKQLHENGFSTITLWVLTTNQNAIQFYKKMGWVSQRKTKEEPQGKYVLHETRMALIT